MFSIKTDNFLVITILYIWQTKVQINTNLCVDTCIYKYNVLFQVLVKSGNHLIDTYEKQQ